MCKPTLLAAVLVFIGNVACAGPLLEHGKPSEALLRIFEILDIKHDGTAAGVNRAAQEKLLRKPGQERWQMANPHEGKRSQLLPVFASLGMLGEVKPKYQSYDYIILYGASVPGMKARLQFLEQLWSQGLRTQQVVYLTGERPLDPSFEIAGWQEVDNVPKTEVAAAQRLWHETVTTPELQSVEVTFISSPMKGSIGPNTVDTIIEWLKKSPKPGRWLAVSSNPFISYQDLTMRGVLAKFPEYEVGVELETVGQAAPEGTQISSFLDNIARVLYTEINSHGENK